MFSLSSTSFILVRVNCHLHTLRIVGQTILAESQVQAFAPINVEARISHSNGCGNFVYTSLPSLIQRQ